MSWTDLLSTDDERDPPNVEVLNVLRESEDLVMGTNDVADAIGRSTDTARDRLKELRGEDRVNSQEIGSSENHTLVWALHPDEREKPVNPDIARLAHLCDRASKLGERMLHYGSPVGLVGILLVVLSLAASVQSVSLDWGNNSLLFLFGYLMMAAGAVTGLIGGGLKFGAVVAERDGERRVEKEENSSNGGE